MDISKDKIFSVIESFLFMSNEPQAQSNLEKLFENKISHQELSKLMEELSSLYKQKQRGLSLKKTSKGWQLQTKLENKNYLLRMKPQDKFRLSRPSLEVLSIIAFEQPCTKMDIDNIRGVESGHLLRTLMEKELLYLSKKSSLPGQASFYKTTHKFLEIFGFESLEDLPSQKELEDLLPQQATETASFNSITQEFFDEKIQIPYEQDHIENKQIKEDLKKLPSTISFLKKQDKIQKK